MAHVVGSLDRQQQFKIRYADKIGDYLSACSILQQRFPFREKERTGELYQMPILTRRTAGGDYAAGGAGQVNFSDILTSKIVKAQLTGSQIFMGDGLEWEAAFASQAPDAAYSDSFDLCIRSIMDSHRFRIELDTLWGQHTGGSIGTVTGTPATSATATVTILAAERSAGILYNIEGHRLDIFASTLTTQRTSAITGITPSYEVISVQPDAGTIVVDNSAGVIADGDVIFLKGQRTTSAWNVAAGIHKWFSNTGSIAGIDASTNTVWSPNVIAVGSLPITFDQILRLSNRLLSRGMVGKLLCVLTPRSWSDNMADMSAAVRRTPSEKKYVLGAEAISFHTGTGEVEIIAHPYQKEGYAHVAPLMPTKPEGYTKEELDTAPIRRIGATDLTFVGPDGKTGNSKKAAYFEKLQRTNILYVETYSHQAPFVAAPAHTGVFTGIVPSTSA